MSTFSDLHLCLIFSPIDNKYKDALTHFAPPLGLVTIHNYILSVCPGISISILDGSVTHNIKTIKEFISENKPDFIAQSVQLISYKYSIEIARYAKSYGSINILGGHHASQIAKQIISNQSDVIDYVVTGDGELALEGIINGTNMEKIPNIVFNDRGRIVTTKHVNTDINSLPALNYQIIDTKIYNLNLKNSTFDNDIDKYLRIYSHKGCGNRGNSTGCIFCGRADKNVRFKNVSNVWKDIINILQTDSLTYIFDVGDDFLFNEKWLIELAEQKPSIINTLYQLGIFGRANRVNSDIAKLLRKINVVDVVIGFESFSSEILKKCKKRNTNPQDNFNAAKHLFDNGIDVCASFVMGLPGENKKSLKKTINGAKEITHLAESLIGRPPRELVANLIEPSPGSPAFRKIVETFPEKYINNDMLSLEELQYDYFRVFFNITELKEYELFRNVLRDAACEIHSLVDYSDSQGWLLDEI